MKFPPQGYVVDASRNCGLRPDEMLNIEHMEAITKEARESTTWTTLDELEVMDSV